MPIYTYELRDEEDSCPRCGRGFELMRPMKAPELTQCPVCRKAVFKTFSGFNTPTVMKPVSTSDAKSAGFKVYKKIGNGEYEAQ
ncbi:MAG: zinc ribbon domain-containing protein [Verrucomicrobiota bacterium]